ARKIIDYDRDALLTVQETGQGWSADRIVYGLNYQLGNGSLGFFSPQYGIVNDVPAFRKMKVYPPLGTVQVILFHSRLLPGPVRRPAFVPAFTLQMSYFRCSFLPGPTPSVKDMLLDLALPLRHESLHGSCQSK